MTLHQRFLSSAKLQKEKLAFIDCTSGKKIPYSRALIASLLLTERFRSYDEGFVGIMVPTSAGCALAVLGVLMSGRIPVMINYSTGAAENAEFAQKRCDFRTIITSKALLEKIDCRRVDGMVFLEDIMESLTTFEKLKAAVKSKLPQNLIEKLIHLGDDEETAVILFTSGSEKEPKAVQLTHKNILANIESLSECYDLCTDDIFLSILPFFHVFGLTANLWAPLYHGMTAITYANPLDFKTVCEIIRREKPTLMTATPSFYWGYLRKSESGDFSSLRLPLCGADKCPDFLREGFIKKHDMVLYEAYGATETSPGISGNAPEANKPGSVGKPFPGVDVMIENYETGEPSDTGETGRILVKGDMVMKGYFNDFEQTSLHIRHGWYDTGDMGLVDEDGYLWHVGRLKRFVKIGGEMVSLVQVEGVLEKLLAEDVLCCVVEIPDAIKGAKIIAVVTEEIDEDAVMKAMADQLPAIAMPKRFYYMEELPKMGSGKIDFRLITEMVHDALDNEKEKMQG